MHHFKSKAIEMRLQGNSYSAISQKLNIPKSTLSGWLSNIDLPENIFQEIRKAGREKALEALLKHNKNQTIIAVKRTQGIQKKSKTGIGSLSRRELLLMGSCLYWAEGYRRLQKRNGREVTHHSISLTNSDPDLIKVFLKFLREICSIHDSKIKLSLRIYPHQDENTIICFWSRVTDIPITQFTKTLCTISKSSSHQRPINRTPYGTLQVRVGDTKTFHKILGWIEGIKEL
jgi:hypothetical protein